MDLTRAQLSLIHVAKTQLALEDDDYRAILQRFGGVDGSAKLKQPGFLRVMDAFTRLGFRSDFSTKNFGDRAGMASSRQVAMIRALWGQFTEGQGTDISLGKWLEGKFKISSVRFVPEKDGNKVIGALKKMTSRKNTNTV